jgi:hypothetical protein
MLRAIAIVLSVLITTAASAGELIPSSWKNPRGSVMHVMFPNVTGGFLGHYTNNAPGYPHCAGVPYPLWGKSDGKTITFTVQWSGPLREDCHSTTTWTGTIKGNVIRTKFVIWHNGKVFKTGHDNFKRQ